MKLNVLLGKVEHLASSYKQSIKDYFTFFSKSQGAFRGIRKTYNPRPETIDLPSERESKAIITTVGEKLDWLVDSASEYINGLFNVECTNGRGDAYAVLKVDEVNFGNLTSLELLRLIGLLESEDLENMYKSIPVRSDAENWRDSEDELYKSRAGIKEIPMLTGVKKSIMKEQYIIKDPNLVDNPAVLAKYTPILGIKDTVIELGDWTIQHFTGEMSQKERAEILKRRTKLLVAAKAALKEANETEIAKSDMTAAKLFSFLHTGKIS
jgi:hypothetical protein